jgi:hypothetical protein
VITLNLKLYAAPLALLMMTVPLAAPKAYADDSNGANLRTVTAAFAYNPAAPASEIYADLEQRARQVCATPGPRPISLRKLDKQCAAGLLEKAVERVGRTDVAALHDHTPPHG